jgi:hypothetical protein
VENCTACGHPTHDSGPCGPCAESNGTCWQKINLTGGDGTTSAAGEIELATGQETRPCCMCRSWEDADKNKIVRFLIAHGLKPNPDGKFETPIAKDFVGRKSLVLDPKSSGYCRKDGIITDGLASCPAWSPTRSISDFQQRMHKRQ